MKKLSYLAVSFLLLAVAITQTGCNGNIKKADAATQNDRASDKASVKVANAEFRSYQPKIQATGNLIPLRRAKISALADGKLEEINWDIGSQVKKGDILFKIDYANFQLAYEQAQANLARIQADATLAEQMKNRTESLYTVGAVSGEQRDRAVAAAKQTRAAVNQAEAALKQARKTFEDCVAFAPFDGVVTAKFVQKGEFVKRGDPIVEFIDLKTLTAELKLPEKYAGGITTDASVVLNCGDFSGNITGTVMAVNPKVETENRTFTVKVKIDNSDLKLQMGLYCVANFDLPTLNDQIAAPPKAVTRDNGQSFVWVISDGKARLRKITEDGTFEDGWVRVVEGLTSADLVVIEGKSGLSEGQEVTISK